MALVLADDCNCRESDLRGHGSRYFEVQNFGDPMAAENFFWKFKEKDIRYHVLSSQFSEGMALNMMGLTDPPCYWSIHLNGKHILNVRP